LTGETAWVKKRDWISWASPILAHTPYGVQVILCSEEDVDAYDAASGKLLWSQDCLGGEVAPSPAYSNGIVFAANEYAMASAIQLTGTADAIQTEILWEYDNLLPEISSPVGDGERFYFATSYGELVCLDAVSSEEKWLEEVSDAGFYSSPVLVGDRLYILDKEGTMYIVRAGAEYEEIATRAIGEETFATPAFMDGRIYVRTTAHLYCIE
ncbi:MAG: PQQ-binding-like beta-propeller repeat protein, partial [Candidatus Hydrogenedentes bacterium]|nr:PQQ-binding-like beta-propeller repeat protein [Candidatus Hydrogenedentota bacterium]